MREPMCGVAGLINKEQKFSKEELTKTLSKMAGSMAYRGPDDEGIWVDENSFCGLAHRRLSIIDTSSGGHQPMKSRDNRFYLTFNGEIYNFQDLKLKLQSQGVQFTTKSDTEVLLAHLIQNGIESIGELDGMFAFCLYDSKEKKVYLARDAFGEKPLYYVDQPNFFAFSSELHTLTLIPGFDNTVTEDTIAEFLTFQYIDAPHSFYKNVKKLEPGSYLTWTLRYGTRIEKYFSFNPTGNDSNFASRSLVDLTDELEDILVRSIKRRMIADVPLGAFLSGGVDSSTVVALIRKKLNLPLKTFAIGFETTTGETEHEYARAVADYLGTEHYEKILSPSAFNNILKIGKILDEPNGDSSCLPTYLISEFIRKQVTVAISGDGGDELFGGYGRYLQTIKEYQEFTEGQRNDWTPGSAYFSSRMFIFEKTHLNELMPTPGILSAKLKKLHLEMDVDNVDILHRMRKIDARMYLPGAVLPKIDRMSMQHSLETRTPFLSIELARFAEKLPLSALYKDGQGKIILKELASRYLPKEWMYRKKMGFGFPTSEAWGKKEILNIYQKELLDEDTRLNKWIPKNKLQNFYTKQSNPNTFSIYQVWQLIILELYLKERGGQPGKSSELTEFTKVQLFDLFNLFKISKIIRNFEHIIIVSSFGKKYWEKLIPHSKLTLINIDNEEKMNSIQLPYLSYQNSVMISEFALEQLEFNLQENFQKLQHVILVAPEGDLHYFIKQEQETHSFSDSLPILAAHAKSYTPNAIDKIKLFIRSHIANFNKIPIEKFGNHIYKPDGGFCYKGIINKSKYEKSARKYKKWILLEDGKRIFGSESSHDDIRMIGCGNFSIWNGEVYFSTSDRTNPNLNKRYYEIIPDVGHSEMSIPTSIMVSTKLLNKESFIELSISSLFKSDMELFKDNLKKIILDDNLKYQANKTKTKDIKSRIFLMIGSLGAGGAERQLCNLAKKLIELNYDVTIFLASVISSKEQLHYASTLKSTGITIRNFSDINTRLIEEFYTHCIQTGTYECLNHLPEDVFHLIMKCGAYLFNEKPDLLYTSLDYCNTLGGTSAILCGIPKIFISFRSLNPSHFPHMNLPWFKELYEVLFHSDRIKANGNSQAGINDYKAWLDLDHLDVKLIRNGLDTSSFSALNKSEVRSKIRAELGITLEQPTMIGIMRFSPEKRPKLFFEVAQKLQRRLPDLHVIMIGSGPLYQDIATKVQNDNLNNFHLIPRTTNVEEYIAASNLTLLTSYVEGSPNVLVESQYLNTPVVATKVGGVPEVLIDGQTGLLADSDNSDDIADKCYDILSNPAKQNQFGMAGKEFVEREFHIDQLYKNIKDLFDEQSL